jgi:hypothetical protein
MSNRAIGERLVLSPLEPLIAGGPAEAFERHLRQLYQSGYRNLILDLSSVPKDVTILFLLMGLGMSAGLGAFAVAGLGTAFLCIALERMSSQKARVMSVEVMASGRQFPSTHVEGVFVRNHIVFEPREISQSDDVMVKYHTWLDPRTSLEDLSLQLMTGGAGVKSVACEHPKRERP